MRKQVLKSEISGSKLNQVSPWMRGVLLIAGAYNLVWGVFIYGFPDQFYSWLAETKGEAGKLVLYQGIGVIILGLLYLLTCLYPVRFWYLILIGLFSKIFGAAGVYFFIINQSVTDHLIFHLVVNDLAWVFPLTIIAHRAYGLRKIHIYEKTAEMD